MAAIETGTPLPSIVAKLQELEARKRALQVQAASLHPVPRLAPVVIENRLAEWRRLIRQSTTQSRTVLQRILRGRLTFTPRTNPISGLPDGYDFTADTRFDRLFTGIAVRRPLALDRADLTGTEGIGPDDTGDSDYGRLLDRVYAEGVASELDPISWTV